MATIDQQYDFHVGVQRRATPKALDDITNLRGQIVIGWEVGNYQRTTGVSFGYAHAQQRIAAQFTWLVAMGGRIGAQTQIIGAAWRELIDQIGGSQLLRRLPVDNIRTSDIGGKRNLIIAAVIAINNRRPGQAQGIGIKLRQAQIRH